MFNRDAGTQKWRLMRNCFTVMVRSVALRPLRRNSHVSFLNGEKTVSQILKTRYQKRREIFYTYQKGNTILPLKNGFVPRDMLVLSIMTLGVDLLRQIATDPHGFSRAHSIGNGLFNFPQGALPFPRNASLKRHLGLVSWTKIFSQCCNNRMRTLVS